MQTGIHALGWAAERLAVVLGLLVFGVLLAYAVLVTVIVVIQAVTGQ
jgi:hypothetical protein